MIITRALNTVILDGQDTITISRNKNPIVQKVAKDIPVNMTPDIAHYNFNYIGFKTISFINILKCLWIVGKFILTQDVPDGSGTIKILGGDK